MDNILIAGSNGVLGRFICKCLENKYIISKISLSKSEKHHSLDLTKKDEIIHFIKNNKKFDILIFLVGLAHKSNNDYSYSDFKKINQTSLMNLLEVQKNHKKLPKKIIFASSISVYGEELKKEIYQERSICSPKTDYGKTKLNAEDFLLKNYIDSSWILRFAPIYSKSFQLNINRRSKIGNFFFKVGDGNNKLSLCNIKNIKNIINGIYEGKIPPGRYNVSDKKTYTYNDLINKHKSSKRIIIPRVVFITIYYFSIIFKNTFMYENSIKLISDNVFPSKKILKYINLPYNIENSVSNE